ncbi:MAG: hypothetical protein ORN50_05990 [Crocinitomicaceae bacterium]|nr:hypothetical protein [Crocinitomicaceae bacterium]
MSYIVTLEKDPETGDLILPLPEKLLEETGWKTGDTLDWNDNGDGTFSMTKKEATTEWVLVECISTFRERYMVEVPIGKELWALDTVTLNEAKEFSQEHLGETIVSHRVVSFDEALKMCDKDNSYCSAWSDDKKMNAFFTKEGENVEL